MTPSTQRRFVVADVNESDSPDDLSTQGSSENLESEIHEDRVEFSDITSSSVVVARHPISDSSTEVIVVSSSAVPDSTGQREERRRAPLQSAPSYSALAPSVDSVGMPRVRSSSLPHNLTSLQSSGSLEKLPQAPSPMPAIPERSITAGSDVFTVSESSSPQHSVHPNTSYHSQPLTTSQPLATSQPVFQPQTHPHVPRPHPPNPSEPPPSSHPLPNNNPFTAIGQQHSEILTDAFMSFLFAMNRALKDPTIQPLVHDLEKRFGEPRSQTGVLGTPPPSSPTSLHTPYAHGYPLESQPPTTALREDSGSLHTSHAHGYPPESQPSTTALGEESGAAQEDPELLREMEE